MQSVEEIQQAIEALSPDDYVRIRDWLAEAAWDDWDRQIAADSEAGHLDSLVLQALEDKRRGLLRDLPGVERT